MSPRDRSRNSRGSRSRQRPRDGQRQSDTNFRGGSAVNALNAVGAMGAVRSLSGEQVEGRRAVRELLIAGRRRVREVLVVDTLEDTDVLAEIVDLCAQRRIPVRHVSRTRLDHLARSDAPQGVLAFTEPLPEANLADLCARDNGVVPFLLAFDGVTDPHNLGSLIRTGECAGVTGVLLPRNRAVHVTPIVAKASAGAVEHVPIAIVAGLPNALSACRDAGVWTVGLDPDGDVDIHDLPVADQPVALVFGAEGAGLSRLTRARCDVLARIPQFGLVASLNVAAAGAVACFEIARRRSQSITPLRVD